MQREFSYAQFNHVLGQAQPDEGESMSTSTEETREVMSAYLRGHGAQTIADDAVFTVMGTGEEARGRTAIGQMLVDLYETAFDARAELRNIVVDGDMAIAEFRFLGTHIGEFMGVPATGVTVDLPFCVAYDVEDGKIVAARIYFELDGLRRQLEQAPEG